MEITLPEAPAAPFADEATADNPPARLSADTTTALVEESLIEEISIDGMCGVY